MTVVETGLFYIGTAIISLFLCRQSEVTGKKLGIVLSAAALIFLSGLRAHTVGVDTMLYKAGVEYFFHNNQISWQYSFSIGYGIFTKLVLSVWNNYSFLLLIQAAITNGLILARFWDYRDVASLSFMLFVYLCTMYYMTLCIICQYLAVAIAFYFSRYLDRGKPLVYCVALVLASAIHISALIGLVPLVLRFFKFKGVSNLRFLAQTAMLLLIPLVAMFVAGQMSSRYSGYFSDSEYASSIGFMVFAQVFVYLFSLLGCGYFSKEGSKEAQIRKRIKDGAPFSLFMYSIGILLNAASYVVAPAGRMAYYFTIFGPVVFGSLVKGCSRSKLCWVCAMLLVVWYVAYGIYTFFFHSSLGIFPYSFFWQ